MKDFLTVQFFSVEGPTPPMECDSLQLPIADSLDGAFSGSYGIRKGHANAVFSLKAGKVVLTKNEKVAFAANISEGFAMVENNLVSITVSSLGEVEKA